MRNHRLLFFVMVFLIVALAKKPTISGYDATARFLELHERISGVKSTHTHMYNISLGVVALPLYGLGYFAAGGNATPEQVNTIRATVAHLNHFLLYGFLVWLYFWLPRRFGVRESVSGFMILGLLYTSLVLPQSTEFFSEILWSIAAFVSLDGLVRALNRPNVGWKNLSSVCLSAALLVWFSVAACVAWVVANAGLAAWAVWMRPAGKGKERAWGRIVRITPVFLASGAGSLLGIGLNGIENWFERGNPLDSGYGKAAFTFLPEGYLGVLLSPGKGVLWFIPAVLLGALLIHRSRLRNSLTPDQRMLIAGWYFWLLGLVLLYGSWYAWGGAFYWGPRFFLSVSICAGLLLGLVWVRRDLLATPARVLLVAVTALSIWTVWFNMTIGTTFYHDCWDSPDTAMVLRSGCHWTWVESPFYILVKPLSQWKELVAHPFVAVTLLFLPVAVWALRRLERAPAGPRRGGRRPA